MISSIIVAYNEEQFVLPIINELKKQQFKGKHEILLADGGSTDNTVELAVQEGVKIVSCAKGKGIQMNTAAKIAQGNLLFFVHADMKLDSNTIAVLQQRISEGYDAGGFANMFENYNEKIKSLGHLMNFRFLDKKEQSDKGFFYGDNGIFVKRNVFETLGGFKEISIMEDYDFSLRLEKGNYKTIKIENPKIVVSARRHVNAGFFKTRFQWVMIRKLYKWGLNPTLLARWYRDVR